MEHFLINSSVCLFALWLFYKLALENTSWHFFKRYYLIGALIISVIIPFVVVETVVIPMEKIPFTNYAQVVVEESMITESAFTINWSYVALSIYAIGVLIMLWRFGKNLYSFKIQEEDEVSSYKRYQLILRNSITIPHSFLVRIFISKKDYEAHKVPAVVLEHEKAHLDQKHSLDVLFIELLLIVFWFNPLLYIIRYSIKLNHEFLADRAVLSQGISTSDYQEILLEQATANYQQAMANTFTFPIIKKRFTIMKTQTSTTSLVLRSLVLIPILALLIISCGKEETEFIEVEEIVIVEGEFDSANKGTENNDKLIAINGNISRGTVTIEDVRYNYVIEDKNTKLYDIDGNEFDFESKGYEIFSIFSVVESLTPEIIKEYNTLAIKHKEYMDKNNSMIVFKGETNRMQTIFNSMSPEQRSNNELWPYLDRTNNVQPGEIPPPPPAPEPLDFKRLIKEVKGKKSKVFIGNEEQDLNQLQQIADHLESKKNINVSFSSFNEQVKNNIKHYYFGNMVFSDLEQNTDFENWRVKNNRTSSFPTPLDHIDFYENQMNYYMDDVKVNAEQAKAFIQKNGNKGIQIMPVNGVNSLKMNSN